MAFQFTPGPLEGLVQIRPAVLRDARGSFFETYKHSEFEAAGIAGPFVQENHSVSQRGVLRGIHYQRPPHAQGKLVRVSQGVCWDVAVDLRPQSPSFLQSFGVELNAEDHTMLYLPPGFGHGFLALSERVEVVYLCTAEYQPASEEGLRWDDPGLAIQWPDAGVPLVLSDRDRHFPLYKFPL